MIDTTVVNSVKLRAEVDSLEKFWEKGDKALYKLKLRLEDTKWGPQYTSLTVSNELITRSVKPGAWVQIVAKMAGKDAANGKFYSDVKAVSLTVVIESPDDIVPSSLSDDEIPF
jgi:3-hydroxymyristoyl/3-hydroxydecanoyl-(acyl carrier protein) dehydratase